MASTLGGNAQKKEIVITVDREGNADYLPKGFKGKECVEATRDYELAMGETLGPRQETSDMFETQDQHLELNQDDE